MKTLYIIRHAKSSWKDSSLDDFDRPLNKRGQRDAPLMGKRLQEQKVSPQLMLASPANRAVTTCHKIAKEVNFPVESIQTNERLYHASDEEILAVVKDLDDKNDFVMLFGHNPGLTDFVNKLMNRSIYNIPTCGIAACTIPVQSWQEIHWGHGALILYDYPKKQE